MFQGLPLKQSVANELGVSQVKGRLYSVTANLLWGAPFTNKIGAYVIGGGGWYRRSLRRKILSSRLDQCANPGGFGGTSNAPMEYSHPGNRWLP